jgi:hypothetical protein
MSAILTALIACVEYCRCGDLDDGLERETV